jgi:hypothetical protein
VRVTLPQLCAATIPAHNPWAERQRATSLVSTSEAVEALLEQEAKETKEARRPSQEVIRLAREQLEGCAVEVDKAYRRQAEDALRSQLQDVRQYYLGSRRGLRLACACGMLACACGMRLLGRGGGQGCVRGSKA